MPGKELSNRFLFNVDIVGPNTSVPKGEVLFFTTMPLFEKNFTQDPSFLNPCFLVLTITALCFDFFIDQA